MTVHAANSSPPGYAVATAHPIATKAGLNILARGGNAFDAAVAVSTVLAVVEPYHSGLGGGGFWLLYDAKKDKNVLIDGREVAPMAATEDMFLDSKRHPVPGLSLNGGLAAAIPGEPAALTYIASHYARLPLSELLAPAIHYAENGYDIDHQYVHFIEMGDRMEVLKKYPESAKIFLKDNKPYQAGERLYQKDLAKTLRRLAKHGRDGFYKGPVAKQLVEGVNRAGGIWNLNDLSSYQIKVREPVEGNFHSMRIITAPLPSAGGLGLVTMLNILEGFELEKLTLLERIHYIIESMRLAFWQRAELMGDPDFERVDVKQLLSKSNAKRLRRLIKKDKATNSQSLPERAFHPDEHHTTHFSIIDKEGNKVSATLTINYIFGSSVVAEGTGVLLNDEMDDFAVKINVRNVFGLSHGEKNGIEPGKRPLSSMAPTFLATNHREAILGTPGGSRIPTMILLAALEFFEDGGAISMVSKMRFHHQYRPDWVAFEPDSLPLDIQQGLKNMGYRLLPLKHYYGDMQAISWNKVLNLLTPASDPRHIGQAIYIEKKSTSGYGVMH